MFKKLFWVLRGLFFITCILFFFAPFSWKRGIADLENQAVFYFDETEYRSYLSELQTLYRQEIQNLVPNTKTIPSQIVLDKVYEKIEKKFNLSTANAYFTTVKDQKPSLAFQKKIQQFSKELNQLESQSFEKNLLVLLTETEQKINLDTNIRIAEKIAFKMMRMEQEILHQEYVQLVHLDRQYFYPKQKARWAYERAQKEMSKKMLKSLWHSAVVLNQVKTEKLEPAQIVELMQQIKNPYWSQKKSDWMVFDL